MASPRRQTDGGPGDLERPGPHGHSNPRSRRRRDAESRGLPAARTPAEREALALLKRRAYTTADLRAKLQARARFTQADVAATIEMLRRVGALDDQSAARSLVRSATRGKPRGEASLIATLARHGIDEDAAKQAIHAERPGGDHAAALRLARQLLDRRPDDMPPERAAARAMAALARRGFDEDTTRHAVLDAARANGWQLDD